MSQTPETPLDQTVTAQTEKTVIPLASVLGFFWGRTYLRLQKTANVLREKRNYAERARMVQTGQPSQPEGGLEQPGHNQVERPDQPGQPVTERAEEIVDRLASLLAIWTARTSSQLQKEAERWREEAEDLWVDVQHIRSKPSLPEKPGEPYLTHSYRDGGTSTDP